MNLSLADGTKLWRGIRNLDCVTSLQNDLDHIYRWAATNNIEFNTKKFQAIHFNDLLGECNIKGSDGSNITLTKIVRDLGLFLFVSDDLSFDHHNHTVIKRGKQMAAWIIRVFKSRFQILLVPLLEQLIIPRVEY